MKLDGVGLHRRVGGVEIALELRTKTLAIPLSVTTYPENGMLWINLLCFELFFWKQRGLVSLLGLPEHTVS